MRIVFLALILSLLPATEAAAEPGLREKIGQMILLGFVGTGTGESWVPEVREHLREGRIGGVLYLKRNIARARAVRSMNREFLAAAGGRPMPFIAIDQEGGKIERLTRRVGFAELPSAKAMARSTTPDAARRRYVAMASALRQWGFNLNLGPVVDLDANPANPVIGSLGRSYSADPKIVTAFAGAFVDAHRQGGVLTALKHFPGHGSSRHDSHDVLPDVSGTWSRSELEPFRDLIGDGRADMVMTAHIRNAQLQPAGERMPASMSRPVIEGILRGQLGFDGVVISDDLQMDGVAGRFDLKTRVLRAVMAGTDILVLANDRKPDRRIVSKVIDILAGAAAEDAALAARIDQSWRRIVQLKARLSAPVGPAASE